MATTTEDLPITKFAIEKIERMKENSKGIYERNEEMQYAYYQGIDNAIGAIRTFEKATNNVSDFEGEQLSKARKEELEKCVEILKSIHNDSESLASKYECSQEGFEYGIEEAITRISNQP